MMSRLLRTLPRLRTAHIPSSRAASALATPVLNANRVAASCPFQPGQIIHGFKVKQVQEVPELQLRAVRLEHEATSADYLHIFRDDLNSVFSVAFKTAPTNDNGLPHILEHIALCGSEKYPVRDPFFKMLQGRSLSTYMNACTAADHTFYPFSSQNEVDFKNLRDVYMDAAFFPRLKEMDFKQEGWRLENENPKDKTTPLIFKGVVYNEMKGAYSDISTLYYYKWQQEMYKGTTYGCVSGGDPEAITSLTHSELVNFHKNRYHPSNAKFFSYGNLVNLDEHLAYIDSKIKHFDRHVSDEVPMSAPFKEGRYVAYAPPDAMGDPERQSKVSISFGTNDCRDVQEVFNMRVLSSLLLDGAASPMHKALLDTNLGTEYSVNSGYSSETLISSMSFGLQGVRASEKELVEKHILEVLEDVAENGTGLGKHRIDAVLHQMEMSQKHKTKDFGFSVLHGALTPWFHGVNPVDLLEINKRIASLKGSLEKGDYFQSLIRKYLRKPTVVFTMEPDAGYTEMLTKNEKVRLEEKTAVLTEVEKEKIYESNLALMKTQEAKEDVSCLPALSLADIRRGTMRYPLSQISVGNRPVTIRETATNGLTYVRMLFPTQNLPEHLRPFMSLFAGSLDFLGTKTKEMSELEEEILNHTGGISSDGYTDICPTDQNALESGIAISSKCLARNIPRMYDLIGTLVNETDFDKTDRLKTLIMMMASNNNNSIAHSGHQSAMTRAASSLSPGVSLSEIVDGLSQIKFMNQLAAMEDLSPVVNSLKELQKLLFTTVRVMVTAGPESIEANQIALSPLLERLNPGSVVQRPQHVPFPFQPKSVNTYVPLPFATNFLGRSVLTPAGYTHPDAAGLQVLATLMSSLHLHRELREKGGAYGGGASFSPLNGLFSFYTYRDPTPLKSMATVEKSIDWAVNRKFTETELTEAKLSIFSSVDAPIAPDSEGLAQFTSGLADEMRQDRRDRLLGVTTQDVSDVAARYLQARKDQQVSTAILGEENGDLLMNPEWEVLSLTKET